MTGRHLARPRIPATSTAGRHRALRPAAHPLVRRVGLVAAGAATSSLLAVAPVFAYYTVAGAGSSGGTTGTLQPLTIQAATVGSPSSSLQPGGTADLLLNVTNPNAVSVTIVSVAQAGGVTVQGGSGCTSDPSWPGNLGTSGVSVATTTGLSVAVAGGATATVHVSGAAVMSSGSVNGCQGASFQVPVTVAVTK